ncbi:hypothetical protein EsH8_V_000885 [Colletotrichum jinshuiense]
MPVMPTQAPPNVDHIYDPSKVTEGAKLPISEDLDRYDTCLESGLLLWDVPGSLRDIAVLDSIGPLTSAFAKRQPFAIFGPDGKPTSFHPIASLPAIYPLVSRISIDVYNLEELADTCCRMAEYHEFDPDDNEDDETDKYCICEDCMESTPFWFYKKLPKLHVDAKEKPYVTLKDVVLAVNDWIPKIWNELLLAETMTNEDWGSQYPIVPVDTKFWVNGDSICSWLQLFRLGRDGNGNIEDRERYWRDCLSKLKGSERKF